MLLRPVQIAYPNTRIEQLCASVEKYLALSSTMTTIIKDATTESWICQGEVHIPQTTTYRTWKILTFCTLICPIAAVVAQIGLRLYLGIPLFRQRESVVAAQITHPIPPTRGSTISSHILTSPPFTNLLLFLDPQSLGAYTQVCRPVHNDLRNKYQLLTERASGLAKDLEILSNEKRLPTTCDDPQQMEGGYAFLIDCPITVHWNTTARRIFGAHKNLFANEEGQKLFCDYLTPLIKWIRSSYGDEYYKEFFLRVFAHVYEQTHNFRPRGLSPYTPILSQAFLDDEIERPIFCDTYEQTHSCAFIEQNLETPALFQPYLDNATMRPLVDSVLQVVARKVATFEEEMRTFPPDNTTDSLLQRPFPQKDASAHFHEVLPTSITFM